MRFAYFAFASVFTSVTVLCASNALALTVEEFKQCAREALPRIEQHKSFRSLRSDPILYFYADALRGTFFSVSSQKQDAIIATFETCADLEASYANQARQNMSQAQTNKWTISTDNPDGFFFATKDVKNNIAKTYGILFGREGWTAAAKTLNASHMDLLWYLVYSAHEQEENISLNEDDEGCLSIPSVRSTMFMPTVRVYGLDKKFEELGADEINKLIFLGYKDSLLSSLEVNIKKVQPYQHRR